MCILSQTLQIYSLEFRFFKNISMLIFIIWIYGICIIVFIIIDIFNLHYTMLYYNLSIIVLMYMPENSKSMSILDFKKIFIF